MDKNARAEHIAGVETGDPSAPNNPRRRLVIKHIAALLSSPVLLSACSQSDEPSEAKAIEPPNFFTEHETRTLSEVAHQLFPDESFPTTSYANVAKTLDKLASSNTDVGALLRQACATLDTLAGGKWLEASSQTQHAALEQWQQDKHFGLILNTSIDTIYRDPSVWQLIGYEGSSLEHGGYLNRGFDDIDWLDEAPQESQQ